MCLDNQGLDLEARLRAELFVQFRSATEDVKKLLDAQFHVGIGRVHDFDFLVVEAVIRVVGDMLHARGALQLLVLPQAVIQDSFSLANVFGLASFALEAVDDERALLQVDDLVLERKQLADRVRCLKRDVEVDLWEEVLHSGL